MKGVKAKLALLLVCVLCLGLCGGCAAEKTLTKYSGTFYEAFDTITTITGYAEDEATFQRVFAQAKAMFIRYHEVYDGYNAYEGVNNLYYVNENAALAPVQAEPELIDLLLWVKEVQPQLLGRMNIALGAVLSVWHDYRTQGVALPPMELLQACAQHTSFDDVIVDPVQGTVYFADPALKLDLGAVAKGYATEIVASWMLTSDMPSYIISAGGNVRCGQKPLDGRDRWGVSIQDPNHLSGYVDVLYLTGLSVVTSGDYQRYYVVDGEAYHHIIDPDTLMPAKFMRSVTVVTQDSGWADALSTTLFLLPYEEGRALVEALEGVEAFWVLNDGAICYTEGCGAMLYSQGASSKD